MTTNSNGNINPQLISYLTLRKVIGILGIAFPIILILGSVSCCGCEKVLDSISGYYHTGMRNLFVGLLCAIGLFLFTYKGYDKADSIAGNIGCFFALGVAFFPTSYDNASHGCVPKVDDTIISTIHYVSAAGLFMTLIYFSICRFTKTKSESENCWKLFLSKKRENRPKGRKLVRNRIYISCGLIMLACIVAIAIFTVLHLPIFLLETIALWAFGISWLTKGETIYAD